MVILFLIALVLAWPTAGLSIIAYVAYAVLKSYWNARTRMHFANENAARRALLAGGKRVPSWAGDETENSIFVEVIQEMAMREGVPLAYLQAVLGNGDTLEGLMHYAGEMEHQGANFTDQQVSATKELVELWKTEPNKVF